jgi:hypothetical protein
MASFKDKIKSLRFMFSTNKSRLNVSFPDWFYTGKLSAQVTLVGYTWEKGPYAINEAAELVKMKALGDFKNELQEAIRKAVREVGIMEWNVEDVVVTMSALEGQRFLHGMEISPKVEAHIGLPEIQTQMRL